MGNMPERERLTEVYRQFWRPVFGYVCRRTDSEQDAADVVSEVFVVARRRIDDLPAGDEARLWLFGVARRVLSEHYRGRRRRHRLASALLAALREEYATDPAELFQRDDEAIGIRKALARLPDLDRDILALVSWEGLTPSQVAVVLNISPVAARARLSRARKRLTAVLDPAAADDRPAPIALKGVS